MALNDKRAPPTKETSWSKAPLSSVSYNSEDFLKSTLQYLIDVKIILDYIYIKHKAESDDTKDHIHLLIVPTRSVDMNKLRETFDEDDPNSNIPLGVMPFRVTQEQYIKEWLLYVLHDEDYLRRKGLKRKYHYKRDELISNNAEWLSRLILELEQIISDIETMLAYIEQGYEWYHASKKLKIGTSYLAHFKDTYKMLQSEFRGFEEFAIDIVNCKGDLRTYQKSVYSCDETLKAEIDELHQQLERATDIIDILLKNKSNEQINLLLKEINEQNDSKSANNKEKHEAL